MRADATDSAGFIDAFDRAAAAGTADGDGGDGRGPSHGFLDQSPRLPSVLVAIDLSWVQVGLPAWWIKLPFWGSRNAWWKRLWVRPLTR